MVTNLVLIGIMTIGTIILTIIRGLFNLPNPETKKEQIARLIFVVVASLTITLNIAVGVRTYQSQSRAPYKLNRQQISLSIKLNCEHCSDSDVDSIKLPSQFTVNNIYFGSSTLSCDFNRIETPVKISGTRSARRQIYYRSSYISFEGNKSSEEYLWDLNGKTIWLSLPNDFNTLFDTARQSQFAWWSGQLIAELDKTSIGEGALNQKKTYNDRPNFDFKLTGLSKEEVEAKWGMQ